ncbi:MAG: ATP-binding protein [Candidatus Omnitrophota bacterium]|nr:ATP-binding protein [Candidatus Omnitrophota bacterium]
MRWVVRIRRVAALLLLVIFSGLWLSQFLVFPLAPVAVAFLFELFLNQPDSILFRRFKDPERVFMINKLLDLIGITWVIHFCGGYHVYVLILLYPLAFLSVGMVSYPKLTYMFANLAFGFYAALVYLESHGIIPRIPSIHVDMSGETLLFQTLLILPLFNLIAYEACYLSGMIRQRESELIAQTKQLKEVNEELDAFVHTASHDLRNPISAISSFGEILETEHKDRLDETGRDYVRRIRRAAKGMLDLIEDLLSLSRISKTETEHEEVSMAEMVRSVTERLEYQIQQHKVHIRVEDNLPLVNCDPVKIKALLVNLISNAIKFSSASEKGPVVEIGYRHHEVYHEFFVRDNGIGIAPENQDKVFEPFKRLHSPKEFAGTGVGLGIVKRVAEGHGGHVWIESELGKGAAFHFTIPKSPKRKQQLVWLSLGIK